MHPIPRLGEAEDAAALAILLSEAAGWISGQVIGVDGGRSTCRGGLMRRDPALLALPLLAGPGPPAPPAANCASASCGRARRSAPYRHHRRDHCRADRADLVAIQVKLMGITCSA